MKTTKWYYVEEVIRWVHRTCEWPLTEASDAEWLTEQLNKAFDRGRRYERQKAKLKEVETTGDEKEPNKEN